MTKVQQNKQQSSAQMPGRNASVFIAKNQIMLSDDKSEQEVSHKRFESVTKDKTCPIISA